MEGHQNIVIINLIDSLTFRLSINVDNPPDIEKNNHHCFEFGLAHALFLLPRGLGALPMHGLSLSLWIILKNPSFVTRNYVLEEIRIIFNVFKSVSTAIHSMFLLLGGKDFWHHFCTHLFHAQIVVQNLSNTFLIDVGKFRNCSNAQLAVSSNNSNDLLHILLSFCSGRTARFWIVPDVFCTLLKLLKPLVNLRAR